MSHPDRPEPSQDSPLDDPETPSATPPAHDGDIGGIEGTSGTDRLSGDAGTEASAETEPSISTVHAGETTTVAADTPLLVVGGGQIGRSLAKQLHPGRPVHYIDDDPTAVDRAARRHDATFVADLTDGAALAAVVDDAGTGVDVVVATPQDATNLLVVQHCRTSLEASRVLVVVADPRAHDVYPSAVERVCAATVLTDAVVSTLESAANDTE